MDREIVSIDEALCNGCGEYVPACAESATQIIDGKAGLVLICFNQSEKVAAFG